MPKKRAKPVKRSRKHKKRIVWWRWIIVLIPLIVGVIWLIALLAQYRQIPVLYEQASPSGIKTLVGLVLVFLASYGAFVFIEFKKRLIGL